LSELGILLPQEAADEIGMSRNTIYNWIQRGWLPAYKAGWYTFVKREHLYEADRIAANHKEKEMKNKEWGKLKELKVWVSTILVDTIFLILWLLCQFVISFLIDKLTLSGRINLLLLTVFQVIFAVSTLSPVLIYIYIDIRLMLIKAKKLINQEKQPVQIGENDDE